MILSTPGLQWFSDHFVAPELRRDPDVNPLFADLGHAAGTLHGGTMDPLLDDSLYMHARWVAAGNEAELDVHPGGVHGLTGFPTEVGAAPPRPRTPFSLASFRPEARRARLAAPPVLQCQGD